MCVHFGWAHDFWRAPDREGRKMGWREFLGWIGVMNRQREGERASPDSWANADQDPGWAEMRRARDAVRGRA